MKKLLLSLAIAIGCATAVSADIYQESPYHETGVVAVKDGVAQLLAYSAFPQTAANGNTYYRWHYGPGYPNFVSPSTLTPLAQGYRFADGRMLVYDFVNGKESVALDFTLDAGDSFTTPDGTAWVVDSREQRTFTTLYGPDDKLDYQAGHTVLKVTSADGTRTDEWIENLGAVRYPLMIQPDDGVEQAHVAYMCYDQESPYLVLDFSDGPLYGQYVGNVQQLQETGSISQVVAESRVQMNAGVVEAEIEIYSYISRVYCYACQRDGVFEIFCRELGPFLDSSVGHSLVTMSFAGVPAGSYSYLVNGREAATAVAPVAPSPHSTSVFDLAGRRLSREPQRGIYLRDGKLVLAK